MFYETRFVAFRDASHAAGLRMPRASFRENALGLDESCACREAALPRILWFPLLGISP